MKITRLSELMCFLGNLHSCEKLELGRTLVFKFKPSLTSRGRQKKNVAKNREENGVKGTKLEKFLVRGVREP